MDAGPSSDPHARRIVDMTPTWKELVPRLPMLQLRGQREDTLDQSGDEEHVDNTRHEEEPMHWARVPSEHEECMHVVRTYNLLNTHREGMVTWTSQNGTLHHTDDMMEQALMGESSGQVDDWFIIGRSSMYDSSE